MPHLFPNSMHLLRDDDDRASVDVVMRTKDRPLLLERALRSVIGQTHRDWHILLINDGGDPRPVDDLVAACADQLSGRITILHNPVSLGMSAAANLGLARGQGAFAAVHDDDDSWQPDFLKEGTRCLMAPENRRYGAVLTKWNLVEEAMEATQVHMLATTVLGPDGHVVNLIDVLRKPAIPPISLLWRSAVVRKAGQWNPHLPVLDDWDLNLRALQIADIAIIPLPLANYHVRRSVGAGAYANTVTEAVPTHQRYNTLYVNSLLRAFLDRDPTQIGLAVALLKEVDQAKQTIVELQVTAYRELASMQKTMAERLDTLEQGVEEMRAMLYDALRQNGS